LRENVFAVDTGSTPQYDLAILINGIPLKRKEL